MTHPLEPPVISNTNHQLLFPYIVIITKRQDIFTHIGASLQQSQQRDVRVLSYAWSCSRQLITLQYTVSVHKGQHLT